MSSHSQSYSFEREAHGSHEVTETRYSIWDPKYRLLLRRIAFFNLAIAILIMIMGSACVGFGSYTRGHCKYRWPNCTWKGEFMANCPGGTAVWQGFVAIVASLVGIFALQKRRKSIRTILVAYQVMCIICALMLWVIIGLCLKFTIVFNSYLNVGWKDEEPPVWYKYTVANMTLDIVIIILSLIYIILSVLSSVLLCRSWGGFLPKDEYQEVKVYREATT